MISFATPVMEDEILSLTELVYLQYGYDFSDYSKDSFKRRLNNVMIRFSIPDIDELKRKIAESDVFFNTFLEEITVNVTEMFRDPEFFKTLRTTILPEFSTQPLIRIWHAGCSSGEEVYSMAILLKEAGMLDKALLYATDINLRVLEKASSGRMSVDLLELYNTNYVLSGGTGKLSDHYTLSGQFVTFHDDLKSRMVFSPHNLVADKSFNEFNLILCRNVLIYFNHKLQNHVVHLFSDSLPPNGFLALGSKEGIDQHIFGSHFTAADRRQRIWKKITPSRTL